MKEIALNNYSWLDIIEPIELEPMSSVWEYIVVLFIVIIISAIFIKYFKLKIRVKLWILLVRLKQDGNTRFCARELLNLLFLQHNTEYAIKHLNFTNQTTINEYRTTLISACYAKNTLSTKQLRNILNKIREWL